VILISHPTANQNVRQTALALAEAGLLDEFWTCVNWKEDGFLDRYLPFPRRVRKELRRRSFPSELKSHIRTFPWREWGRLVSSQLGLKWTTRGESGLFSMDAVYFSLDRRVARHLASNRRVKAVYAYDNVALESFRAAKSHGMKCIYEHPVVYWRKVREYQLEEAELHPEWAPTLGALGDTEEKLARKDQELALADVVIAPSTFSSESLRYAPELNVPVQIIAYGAPSVNHRTGPDERAAKLRVLFVGALSQAKGLGYLLQAASHLERQIELTLIGQRVSAVIPDQAVLKRHRWLPSLPHDQLLEEMSRHDVLVLPSLHEGFGLVIPEAMAQGLVVITTPHTAGPDLIAEGVDGFIAPIRSAEAIEEKLELLIMDRNLLADMKLAARRKAGMRPWEIYRRQLGSMARAVVQ
jgi:glycosyltransferase involved in cell wall biosynthesis